MALDGYLGTYAGVKIMKDRYDNDYLALSSTSGYTSVPPLNLNFSHVSDAVKMLRYNGFDTDEIYVDPTRYGVRTKAQDAEIRYLKGELNDMSIRLQNGLVKKVQEEKGKKKELEDLIAYYYNKCT